MGCPGRNREYRIMMNLLSALLPHSAGNAGGGTFNIAYNVDGAGTAAVNGTYYAMMSPDVVDQWGNPVYLKTGAAFYLFASAKNGDTYTFKISDSYSGGATDYYSWSGTEPQAISNQTVLSGGSAPFPTIQ